MTDYSSQADRCLKTEDLYKEILDLVCDNVFEEIGETAVRGKLDRLLIMGKIEGRVVSHTVHGIPVQPRGDRLIEDWQRIVEAQG